MTESINGKLKDYAMFPEKLQDKIQSYKDRIGSYIFPCIILKDAPIDIATEVFTRLNDSGKQLTVFEIMVAKTFDSSRNFDLSEKCQELLLEFDSCDYGTIPNATILQVVSVLICKECHKKNILSLSKKSVIDMWKPAVDSMCLTIDFFRNAFRIPASRLLPYPSLIIPFSYFSTKHREIQMVKNLNYCRIFFGELH